MNKFQYRVVIYWYNCQPVAVQEFDDCEQALRYAVNEFCKNDEFFHGVIIFDQFDTIVFFKSK